MAVVPAVPDPVLRVRDSVTVFPTLIPPSTIGVEEVLLFYDADRDSTFDPGEDDPSFFVLDPLRFALLYTAKRRSKFSSPCATAWTRRSA